MSKFSFFNGKFLVGKIPIELISIADSKLKYKNAKSTLYKLYTLILIKVEKETQRRKNRGGKKTHYYVHLSSTYFRKSINSKYKRYLDILIDNTFVGVLKREMDFYERQEKGINFNLGDEPIYIETYSVGFKSKGYTIIKYPSDMDKEFKFKLNIKESQARIKNRNFLLSLGISNNDIKITTDQYGHRLYHNLSHDYKEKLRRQSIVYYDLKTSIPYHIYNYLINNNFKNDPFIKLFNGDFYENWQKEIATKITERKTVKRSFNTYLNGKKGDYSPLIDKKVKQKFPVFHKLKNRGLGKKMVIQETDLILNKVVAKLPVSKILTIHDGFIIYKSDENTVDKYLLNLKDLKEFKLEKKKI